MGAQLGSLVAAGLVEETPSGGEGGAPVYRLAQQRRRRSAAGRSRQGSNGSMHSLTGHPQVRQMSLLTGRSVRRSWACG